jgi:hypothetical protein
MHLLPLNAPGPSVLLRPRVADAARGRRMRAGEPSPEVPPAVGRAATPHWRTARPAPNERQR